MRSKHGGKKGPHDFFIGQRVIIRKHNTYSGCEAEITGFDSQYPADIRAALTIYFRDGGTHESLLYLYRLEPLEEEIDLGEYADY